MRVRRRGNSLQRPAIACALAVLLVAPSTLDATEPAPPQPPAEVHAPPTVEPAPQAEPPAGSPALDTPAPATTTRAPARAAGPAPQPAQPAQAPPAATAAGAPARAAASGSVAMQDFSFSPATVSVNTGDSVTWTNSGREPHTATGQGFDTGTVRPGESGSATFSSAGSFSYVCSLHPNMRGTVRVAAAAAEDDDTSAPAAEGSDGSQQVGTAGQADSAGASTSGAAALPASGRDTAPFGLLGVALLALGVFLRWRTAGS